MSAATKVVASIDIATPRGVIIGTANPIRVDIDLPNDEHNRDREQRIKEGLWSPYDKDDALPDVVRVRVTYELTVSKDEWFAIVNKL